MEEVTIGEVTTIEMITIVNVLQVTSFENYVDLHTQSLTSDSDDPAARYIYSSHGSRWEVAVAVSDGGFAQTSFVNGISTSRGGTHVDHVTNQVVSAILAKVQKKDRGRLIKPIHVSNKIYS